MDTVSPIDRSRRFSQNPEVRATLADIHEALTPLSHDLDIPAFNGLSVYGLDTHYAGTAATLVSVDAPQAAAERNDFRVQNIDNHRISLAHTAFGENLKLKHPEFIVSSMKPEQHLTWANRLTVDNDTIGGVQFVYDYQDNLLPGNDQLEKIWDAHRTTLSEVGRAVLALDQKTTSLADSLEILPPITPNAYVVRWDIENSTQIALSPDYGALQSYQRHWRQSLSELAHDMQATTLDQGDGQNIIISLPPRLNPHDQTELRLFATRHIQPFIEKMQRAHRTIAESYDDIQPTIRIAIGLGAVEIDLQHTLNGPVLWETSSLRKDDTPGSILLTPAARNTLRHLETQ